VFDKSILMYNFMKNKFYFFLLIIGIMTGSCAVKTANEKEIQEKLTTLSDGVFAEIITSKGTMLAELYYDKTPMTVANFVGLSEGSLKYDTININKKFYEGIIFHRVISNFMIQTGDPLGQGTGGPGYSFPDEIISSLKHDQKGILSMANSGPKTNGSQFFITQVPAEYLNGKHTVFGKVIGGLNIIDSIAVVEKGSNDKPIQDVVIKHIKIIRKGEMAQKFTGQDLFYDQVTQHTRFLEKQKEDKKKAFFDKIIEEHPNAIKTSSGLMYIVENEKKTIKEKPVLSKDTVELHYIGSFLDSSKPFDSSYDRNKPITVVAGTQSLIAGFEEGLLLSKKGQKIKLFIPYYLAYGESGAGPIPGFSDLVFDLEILDVR